MIAYGQGGGSDQICRDISKGDPVYLNASVNLAIRAFSQSRARPIAVRRRRESGDIGDSALSY